MTLFIQPKNYNKLWKCIKINNLKSKKNQTPCKLLLESFHVKGLLGSCVPPSEQWLLELEPWTVELGLPVCLLGLLFCNQGLEPHWALMHWTLDLKTSNILGLKFFSQQYESGVVWNCNPGFTWILFWKIMIVTKN